MIKQGISAIKVVMSVSLDSQVLKKQFTKERLEKMVRKKFYGATVLFTTGVFQGELERSAQLIVWYRHTDWKSTHVDFLLGLLECVRIGKILGQKSILIEITIVGWSGRIMTTLLEIRNKKYAHRGSRKRK